MAVTVAAPGFSKAIGDDEAARWGPAGGVGFLISAAWTEGEAQERGVVVSDADARAAMADPHDGLSRQDRIYEGRINLLNAALHGPVSQAAAQGVTQAEIDAYVQTHPLSSPEERRVRLLIARNPAQARAIERALRRGVTWDVAGRRYTHNGGPGLLTYQAPATDGLERALFKAAKHRITRYGRYVFKVQAITPGGPVPIDQQRSTAWEVLAGDAQEQAIAAFDSQIAAKWRPRTTCAPPGLDAAKCGNSPTGQ